MKSLVVYNSKTGFTQRYAQWLAQAIGCEAVSLKKFSPEQLDDCGVIFYGGSLMAAKVSGWEKFKPAVCGKGKQLVLFAVGASPAANAEYAIKVKADNLTPQEQATIPFYYLEGGINFEKMGFFPRLMLKMVRKSIEGKTQRTPEEEDALKLFSASFDHTDPAAVEPLALYARSLA